MIWILISFLGHYLKNLLLLRKNNLGLLLIISINYVINYIKVYKGV